MFSYSTFEWLFLNLHNLALWLPAFCLAVLLRVITHNYHHQLIFPACKSYTGIQIPSAEAS
jgi:SulP family sulfate permease